MSAEPARPDDLFQIAFHASPDSVLITRLSDGLFVDINPGFTALSGYTREDVTGRTTADINLWEDPADRIRFVAALQRDGEVKNLECRFRLKDGSALVGLVSARVVTVGGQPHILTITRDITERIRTEARLHQAQLALEESERLYRTLFESAAHGSLLTRDGRIVEVNAQCLRLFACTREYLIGKRPGDVSPPTQRSGRASQEVADEQRRVMMSEGFVSFEFLLQRADGTLFDADIGLTRVELPGPQLALAVVRDVSDRRRLEAQYLQAQKMEAVGRLAGGVAHDFNNVLTAIRGYSSLVAAGLLEGPIDDEARESMRIDLAEIERAAERASGLTRQLLAFSRRQVLEPKTIDPNALVRDLEKMLRRLIGEDIEILMVLDPEVGAIQADPGQMEQVLVNLAVNARDAMPRGGRLSFETSNVDLDEPVARGLYDVLAGRYVGLAVSDTGSGMSKEVAARVFEPFFTTKERGKGTGLGLATVYGIVKQSGGYIHVYSEPGHGTTFRIFMPRSEGPVMPPAPPAPAAAVARGHETVLLVEDEPQVRGLQARVLEAAGYRVLTAGDADEAERRFAEADGQVDLLVTDVVMPGRSGRQLADSLLAEQPGLKVLYVSGYTESAIVHAGVLDPGINFLAKPCSPDGLAREVRRILDQAS